MNSDDMIVPSPDFDKVILENPDYTDAYFQRGLAEAELDRHEDTIKDCNKAIRLKSDDTDAYYNRGNAEADLKQYEAPIRTIDSQTERRAEGEESEFWAPIRRGEFGELFAGQPVPVGNDGYISKRIRGVELILSFRKDHSYVSFLCRGENRIECRGEIITLFPEADYDYYPRESPQRAGFGFHVINKGKDHPENWGEIREKLVTMGTDIYNKIKESDL